MTLSYNILLDLKMHLQQLNNYLIRKKKKKKTKKGVSNSLGNIFGLNML